MAEALWQLVGWDLVDYCIIIQWAHNSNSTDNFDTARRLQRREHGDSSQVTSGSWQARRVVKAFQVNDGFMRGNWPEASWMRGRQKAHRRELCHTCRLWTCVNWRNKWRALFFTKLQGAGKCAERLYCIWYVTEAKRNKRIYIKN